jgi:hypothetical protein
MKVRVVGLSISGTFAALLAGFLLCALGACGKSGDSFDDGGPPGGYYQTLPDGNRIFVPGMSNPDGSAAIGFVTPGVATPDAGSDATTGSGTPTAIGSVNSSDCMGCRFPAPGAATCSNAPAIQIVYPADAVILPPNLNVLSVQWTPYGAGYQRFSVDFSAPPNTDWHILTSCANETTDMQDNGNPSGGCELTVDPVSWSKLAQTNRDSSPVAVTVRGTTDGRCVTSSNTININLAKEDLLGTYYYWKSTVTSNGVGGQIWMKVFGDLNMTEQDVTSNVATANGTLQASCNGCHALSRDGTRMVIYSDDSDSDDEYSDVGGSFLDMTPLATGGQPVELGKSGLTGQGFMGAGGGQPPGFSTLHPNATSYLTSNGLPQTEAGAPGGLPAATNGGYPANVPSNGFTIWDANGNFSNSFAVGAAADRPTMPDWSIDGTSVIYVLPSSVANYQSVFGARSDDDHVFGGSLYTIPYTGGGMFGMPTVLLKSNGENNYYPSYSPDSTASEAGLKPPNFVLFNRVAKNSGASTDCNNGFCPNDSFSNPDARLWLMPNMANGTPIDLEKANGSPASSPVSLSNSYPRWTPFVQVYHGTKILWFTFSSTRDYGLRVLNHKSGMYQCYPADAAETPGGLHNQQFDSLCQQPQIWMAPILFKESQSTTVDPSAVAFWVPYQDMTTHNHTAQWTWTPNPPPPQPPDGAPPPCSCSHFYGPCGAANACGCCAGEMTKCSGSSTCIPIVN